MFTHSNSSPETVKISRRMLFLSFSRVRGLFHTLDLLNFPRNKSRDVLNQDNVGDEKLSRYRTGQALGVPGG